MLKREDGIRVREPATRRRSDGTAFTTDPEEQYPIANISVTGALLETNGPLPPGQTLDLVLRLGAWTVRVVCEIVRSQDPGWGLPGGVGVRFRRFARGGRRVIRDYVEEAAVPPSESREVRPFGASPGEPLLTAFDEMVQELMERGDDDVHTRVSTLERQLSDVRRGLADETKSHADTVAELEETVGRLLVPLSLGLPVDETPFQRILPLRLYLEKGSERTKAALRDAIKDLTDSIGFQIARAGQGIPGSWFQMFWTRSEEILSLPEVQERLALIERALELEGVHGKQAEIDKNVGDAVARLIEALADERNACIQVGSLLIVKLTDEQGHSLIVGKNLSQQELLKIERNPDLLRSPDDVLEKLGLDARRIEPRPDAS